MCMYFFHEGENWLYGCWFYRPNETFHLATRKFLEKEVFKSDYYNKIPVSKILGKCVVMFVKVISFNNDSKTFSLNKHSFALLYNCKNIISKCSDFFIFVAGVFQDSAWQLQTWRCFCLRVSLFCENQVLQKDQDVDDAP